MSDPTSSSSSSSTQNAIINDFKTWFRSNGGHLDPRLEIRSDDARGVHIQAISPIPFEDHVDLPSNSSKGSALPNDEKTKGSTDLIICPEQIMITEPRARGFIRHAQGGPAHSQKRSSDGLGATDLEAEAKDARDDRLLSERQWIASYLVLHLIADEEEGRDLLPQHLELPHLPYTRLLPSEILTPLHYTPAERALLEGTNLHPSIDRRREDWEAECESARKVVCSGALAGLSEAFNWQRYLLASTYITSRSFPSSLLQSSDIAIATIDNSSAKADSYPIMIPGIDLLNHRRAEPVTWTPSQSAADASSHVGFGVRKPIEQGEEVFNNYGPKGNEELLLAYGFVIPTNPSSTCSVKLGLKGQLPDDARMTLDMAGLRIDETFQVRADESIPERLIRVVRVVVGAQGGDEPLRDLHEVSLEIERGNEDVERRTMVEMDAMDVLESLFSAKLSGAGDVVERIRGEKHTEDVREKVWGDCFEYAQEQRDILQAKFTEVSAKMEEWQTRLEEIGFGPGDEDDDEAE